MLVGPTIPRCKHTHPFPDGATVITVETKPAPYTCSLCELDDLRAKLLEARTRARELAQAIFESFPAAHTPKIRALLRKWDSDGLG